MTVVRIATEEAQDSHYEQLNKVKAGRAGAPACAASMTPDERSAIARTAAIGEMEVSDATSASHPEN